jgi:glucosamine--fructose-6-phosphate aminotransferase (isomerizing)
MAKEIHDQPAAVADTLLGRTDADRPPGARRAERRRGPCCAASTRSSSSACGTAAYAGMVAKYAIEHWCRIPTEVELAHEFRTATRS